MTLCDHTYIYLYIYLYIHLHPIIININLSVCNIRSVIQTRYISMGNTRRLEVMQNKPIKLFDCSDVHHHAANGTLEQRL